MDAMVEVLHRFSARSSDELALEPGEMVQVLERTTDGWWVGESLEGDIGVFPFNYVAAVHGGDRASGLLGSANGSLEASATSPKPSRGSMSLRSLPIFGNFRTSAVTTAAAAAMYSPPTSVPGVADGEDETGSAAASAESDASMLAVPSGDILKQGYLLKKGHIRRNWNRRWFVLQGSSLVYYTAPGDRVPKGRIELMPQSVVEPAKLLKRPEDHPYCIQLTNVVPANEVRRRRPKTVKGRDSMVFREEEEFVLFMDALNKDEMDSWIQLIQLSISKFSSIS